MTREQLEHVLRAAASIVGVTDLVVIGSQAVLGTFPDWQLPKEAVMSVEAVLAVDVLLARLDPAADETALADRIDGAIGEGSLFQQTHGYYAQGVETVTASLGPGWRERLVPFVCEASTPKVVGWCLEVHDLWAAKAAAARAKDERFCRALAGGAWSIATRAPTGSPTFRCRLIANGRSAWLPHPSADGRFDRRRGGVAGRLSRRLTWGAGRASSGR